MNRPILLVEDDPDDEALVRRALSGSRVPNVVVAVRDGGEALDYLFTLGAWRYRNVEDQPALVLLDIDLPTVNGFEVLRQIRADPLTRHLPVVMLTSSRNPGDVVSGYDAGANSYVVKPVDLDQFLELTRELGRYWSQINAVPSAARDREPAHAEPSADGPQLLLFDVGDGWLGASPPAAAARALEAAARATASSAASETIEIHGPASEPSRTWQAVLRRLPDQGGLGRVAVALVERVEPIDVERRRSRYDRVLQTTNDAVWDWNVVTHETWWNPRHYEMLGYDTSTTPTFEAWASRIHPDDRPRVLEGFDKILRSTAITWRDEYRFLLPDGRVVFTDDCGYIDRDAAGSPVRLIGIIREITESRGAEPGSRADEGQVVHAQKGRLAGGSARDVDYLLTMILGGIEAVDRRLREQPVQATTLDVNASCRRVEHVLRRLLNTDFDFVMELSEPIGEVRAAASQIEQMLLHLVMNAREGMPAGGRIEVETRNVSVANTILDENVRVEPGEYVALEVHTHAGGIGPDGFEPSFTTKRDRTGLATCDGIAQELHGHVLVHDEPGGRAQFRILLPRVPTGS